MHKMLNEMDEYLGQVRSRSESSCTTLQSVGGLLTDVGGPLSTAVNYNEENLTTRLTCVREKETPW